MLVVEVLEKRTEVVRKGLVSGRPSVTGASMVVGSVNTGSREVAIGAPEDFVRSWAVLVIRVRAQVVSVVDVDAPSRHSSTRGTHVSQGQISRSRRLTSYDSKSDRNTVRRCESKC